MHPFAIPFASELYQSLIVFPLRNTIDKKENSKSITEVGVLGIGVVGNELINYLKLCANDYLCAARSYFLLTAAKALAFGLLSSISGLKG